MLAFGYLPRCPDIQYLVIILNFAEMVLLLCILTIIHIFIIIPQTWLEGNCTKLNKHDFGVVDTAMVVDWLGDVMKVVMKDGAQILDNDYMIVLRQLKLYAVSSKGILL